MKARAALQPETREAERERQAAYYREWRNGAHRLRALTPEERATC